VLYGVFISSIGAFDGDVIRHVTADIFQLAEKQTASFPRVIGHNFVAFFLTTTGDFAAGRALFDQAIALYDPAVHRPLATRFGEDQIVPSLIFRSRALWALGYPEAALRDTDDALKNAREIGQAATLMVALHWGAVPLMLFCGDYSRASALAREVSALAGETDAPFWKVNGSLGQGSLLAVTGEASVAVEMITSGIAALRSMGFTLTTPEVVIRFSDCACRAWQFRGYSLYYSRHTPSSRHTPYFRHTPRQHQLDIGPAGRWRFPERERWRHRDPEK
jgi:hypothetical protein